MSIKALVEEVHAVCAEREMFVPSAASRATLTAVPRTFDREFPQPLPEAYRLLLLVSDGILANG